MAQANPGEYAGNAQYPQSPQHAHQQTAYSIGNAQFPIPQSLYSQSGASGGGGGVGGPYAAASYLPHTQSTYSSTTNQYYNAQQGPNARTTGNINENKYGSAVSQISSAQRSTNAQFPMQQSYLQQQQQQQQQSFNMRSNNQFSSTSPHFAGYSQMPACNVAANQFSPPSQQSYSAQQQQQTQVSYNNPQFPMPQRSLSRNEASTFATPQLSPCQIGNNNNNQQFPLPPTQMSIGSSTGSTRQRSQSQVYFNNVYEQYMSTKQRSNSQTAYMAGMEQLSRRAQAQQTSPCKVGSSQFSVPQQTQTKQSTIDAVNTQRSSYLHQFPLPQISNNSGANTQAAAAAQSIDCNVATNNPYMSPKSQSDCNSNPYMSPTHPHSNSQFAAAQLSQAQSKANTTNTQGLHVTPQSDCNAAAVGQNPYLSPKLLSPQAACAISNSQFPNSQSPTAAATNTQFIPVQLAATPTPCAKFPTSQQTSSQTSTATNNRSDTQQQYSLQQSATACDNATNTQYTLPSRANYNISNDQLRSTANISANTQSAQQQTAFNDDLFKMPQLPANCAETASAEEPSQTNCSIGTDQLMASLLDEPLPTFDAAAAQFPNSPTAAQLGGNDIFKIPQSDIMGAIPKPSENQQPPPPPPAGLKAIIDLLTSIYPDQTNPLQINTIHKYWLGGPDPLDYISMYSNAGDAVRGIPPHWHYVSFGLSDLHGDGRVHAIEKDESEMYTRSGMGFELSFRLQQTNEELQRAQENPNQRQTPPTWPATLMQSLAKYCFQTGNSLFFGDNIPWRKSLDDKDSLVRNILIAMDVQLGSLETPNGIVDFCQIVGVTDEELEQASRWNGRGVLNYLRQDAQTGGEWLITNMQRVSSVFELFPERLITLQDDLEKQGSDLAGINAEFTFHEIKVPKSATNQTKQEGTQEHQPAQVKKTSEIDSKMLNIQCMADANNPSMSVEFKDEEFPELPSSFPASMSISSSSIKKSCPLDYQPQTAETIPLEGIKIVLAPSAASYLMLAIKDRLRHGRHFTFKGQNLALTLVAESVTGAVVTKQSPYNVVGYWLQILITDDLIPRMIDDFKRAGLESLTEEMQHNVEFDYADRHLTLVIGQPQMVLPPANDFQLPDMSL